MNEEHDTIAPPPLAPLYAALAKAQAGFGDIVRNRQVTVQPKQRQDADGKSYWPKPYTFDYAPLEEVLNKCLPALNANELALFHRLDLKGGELITVLAHSSGATIQESAPIGKGDWQQVGSSVTYARRYTVQCLLGVAAEYDDDGNAADGNDATPAQKQPRSQPTPPAVTKPKDEPKNRPKQETVRPVESAPAAQPPPLPKSEPPPPITMTPDDHKPDGELLVAGSFMSAALGQAFKAAGVDTDVNPLKVKRIILETTGKALGAPGVNLTYGDARLLLKKLPEMTPEQIAGTE